MVKFKVDISGTAELKSKLGAMFQPDMMKVINKEIAYQAQNQTAEHIAKASVSRHKTIARLGAKATKHFEDAPARVRATQPEWNEKGATITIANTPGILRAFGEVMVRAKNAQALTIPIHRASYGKRVADVKREGYSIFRPRGKSILLGKKGSETIPLYALKKSVVLPKDEGLLPTREEYADRALDVIEGWVDAHITNG